MNRGTVQVHPAALEEAEAAMAWYAARSYRAAERFLAELGRAVEQVSTHPDRFPMSVLGTRRMLLRKFPFVIVFRETEGLIQIVAIAHGRRRPRYWQDRV